MIGCIYCSDMKTMASMMPRCEYFEWAKSMVKRDHCIDDITSTIAEDGTVNDNNFRDLYIGTVLEDQMNTIRKEYEKCASDAQTFYNDNKEMVAGWMTGWEAE